MLSYTVSANPFLNVVDMQITMSGKASDFARSSRAPTSSSGSPLISRKDTIIIAMLVNIALLVVLFATASRRQESLRLEQAAQIAHNSSLVSDVQVVVSQPAAKKLVSRQPVDEIDEILARFATSSPKTDTTPAKVAATSIAASTNAATTKPAAEPEYYIVKSGDNPWTIARKFHIKFEELLKLNDLDEAKAKNLKIGQKLRIR